MALMIVAAFAVMLFRQPDPRVRRPPLSPAERFYVIIAVVPVLMALVAPSIIVAIGAETAARGLINRVSNGGIGLSLVLTVVGAYFLWRKRRQASGPSLWLCAAVLVAAVPTTLLAILVIAHASLPR